MKLLRTFGWGEKKLLAAGLTTVGKVTDVKRCWWLKVNTKPVRTNSYDGALFPHMAEFTYEVEGVEYRGKCYVSYTKPRPGIGQRVTVYYDPQNPEHFAVKI